jgi:hypothetical protein
LAHSHAPAPRSKSRRTQSHRAQHSHSAPNRNQSHDHGHDHGVETENLFGFTLGSGTEERGKKGVALEALGRFGKSAGAYTGISQKLEFAYGVTDDVSVSLGLLGDFHRVRGVPDLPNIRGWNVNGMGGELRWRLLRRGPDAFGVTLHLEPSWQRVDELTGLRATKFASENKLILDTELVKDRVFVAFNLIQEVEHVREIGAGETEKASKIGIAAAAAVRVGPSLFVGGELRYLRAYEGYVPDMFRGDALYLGPTLFWQIASNAWLSLAWNAQIAGHEAGTFSKLDLINFERNQARLKLGFEF